MTDTNILMIPTTMTLHRAHSHDAGSDLIASESVTLAPFERKLVSAGGGVELPPGTTAWVCSRSGLALKKGVIVLNAPGVIDAGYRNDVGVILMNLSQDVVEISEGDRIAQMLIVHYPDHEFVKVDELSPSSDGRGMGGFGSSGFSS